MNMMGLQSHDMDADGKNYDIIQTKKQASTINMNVVDTDPVTDSTELHSVDG